MKHNLMIVGPQGVGKGTQAALLGDVLGIPHISTGDLFRSNISLGTELGLLAQSYMKSGNLVPDMVTERMVAQRLMEKDTRNGFLLDGFPRNILQATWLSGLLDGKQDQLDHVIVLDAPDEVVMERMLGRGRADDTAEVIATRLEIYKAETEPLIEFYGSIVLHVDGVGAIDDIHRRVLVALDQA